MSNIMFKKTAERLINAVNQCTCSFTTVLYGIERLEKAGFTKLELNNMSEWKICKGDKVYINVYDGTLFAFNIGDNFQKEDMLRIGAAHTDQPALYIKPNPEMNNSRYGKLNVEIYGGPILNTWLDRPLSVSGKLALRSKNLFSPETVIVDIKKKLFTIPNLAIHMNREINKGIELNKQTDMLPLCKLIEDDINKNDFFLDFISKELDVNKEDILDFELYIYNAEDGCVLGLSEDILSSPRLDNITSVEAMLNGIINSNRKEGINGIVLYDNEEIGSRTKQGADSNLLLFVLEKIYSTLGINRNDFISAIANGFFVSADAAHAMHPNRSEKSDLTNINLLNSGLVIKRACSQTYATDCQSIAVVEQICKECDILYQKFSSRSDATTGSTLGTIANKYLPMRSVDIGVPMLAMHSARETMGIKDQYYLEQFVKEYFSI